MYDEAVTKILRNEPLSESRSDVIDLARSRNMLHEVRAENRYGEQSKGVLAIKEREEYQKRPSVRALKRSRDAGGRSM